MEQYIHPLDYLKKILNENAEMLVSDEGVEYDSELVNVYRNLELANQFM